MTTERKGQCISPASIDHTQMSSLSILVSSLYRSCKIISSCKEVEGQWSEEALSSQLTQLICVDLDWQVGPLSSRHNPRVPLLPVSLLTPLT